MCQRILIIEDDRRIANWLQVYLERAGFRVEVASDGWTGLASARSLAPDLILLDLMLPRLGGIELCRILRAESDVPIIMLTAKEAHVDRIKGLDSGADDYIVKPFDPEEVVARVKAVLRRIQSEVRQVLACGNIILDIKKRQVSIDERPVALSQAQFTLLAAFMRHPNQVLTRDQLIALAFNDNFSAYDRAIDSHILRLRKQLGAGGHQLIRTVYGAGYKLVAKDG
ncbi:MAG: response regulator transcription factor [Chloroflexi bacterium]|nr:response regulator transcription factor [Chloroflexota bacterium]